MLYRISSGVYAAHPDGGYVEVAAVMDGDCKTIVPKKARLETLPGDAFPMTLAEALIVMQPEPKPQPRRKKGGVKDVSDL